jgi:WD40 repeat protein
VAWSPVGTRLASGSRDGKVNVWDATTGRRLRTLEGHTGEVRSVAWSPDGTRLASYSWDGTVVIWDLSE